MTPSVGPAFDGRRRPVHRRHRGCTRSRQRRCGSPVSGAGQALLHLSITGEPLLPVDDRHGLHESNQAAHGDREFGSSRPVPGVERKTVFVTSTTSRSRPRSGAGPGRRRGHALQTLRLARFGDMRNVAVTEGDKVEAQIRFGVSVNTRGVNDRRRRGRGRRARRWRLVAEYRDRYERRPTYDRAAPRFRARPPASRPDCAFSTTAGSARSRRTSRIWRTPPAPGLGVQRLMAEATASGARGTEDRAPPRHQGHGPRAPGGAVHEDCTYHLGPGTPKTLGAPCSRLPVDRRGGLAGGAPSRSATVRIQPAWSSTPPGPAIVVGLVDLGDRFRRWPTIDTVPPDEPPPSLPVARAVWIPRPDLRTSAMAHGRRSPPHRVHHRGRPRR